MKTLNVLFLITLVITGCKPTVEPTLSGTVVNNNKVEHIRVFNKVKANKLVDSVSVTKGTFSANFSLKDVEVLEVHTAQNKYVFSKFERILKDYFSTEKQLEYSLSSVDYFADKVNLSAHYLSDVLKKETGRSAKDHINDYVIELAKTQLIGTNQSVSEIAYSLGFNYPHYFTRLFKNKTGHTPSEYKHLN